MHICTSALSAGNHVDLGYTRILQRREQVIDPGFSQDLSAISAANRAIRAGKRNIHLIRFLMLLLWHTCLYLAPHHIHCYLIHAMDPSQNAFVDFPDELTGLAWH